MASLHDALIFDLDGTLWDSTAACATGWNRAMDRLGRPEPRVTPAQVGGIMGLPHDRIFERFFPDAASEARERIGDECYREEIREILASGAPLYPGVREGIERLAASYPLYVVSNCLRDYLDAFFERTGLGKHFRGSLCHGDTTRAKAENLAELVGRERLTDAAYLGDTAGDQIAAAKAGLAYYHVGWGFGRPDRECLVFRDFGELVAFFVN